MISAAQRGQLVGFKVSTVLIIPSCAYARELGHALYQKLRKAHYAHIEPEEEFVDGVVMGIASRQGTLSQEERSPYVSVTSASTCPQFRARC